MTDGNTHKTRNIIIVTIVILIVLVGIALVLYFFVFKKKKILPSSSSAVVPIPIPIPPTPLPTPTPIPSIPIPIPSPIPKPTPSIPTPTPTPKPTPILPPTPKPTPTPMPIKYCPVGDCEGSCVTNPNDPVFCKTLPNTVNKIDNQWYITIPNTTDTSKCLPLSAVTPVIGNSVRCILDKGSAVPCLNDPTKSLNEGCYVYNRK